MKPALKMPIADTAQTHEEIARLPEDELRSEWRVTRDRGRDERMITGWIPV